MPFKNPFKALSERKQNIDKVSTEVTGQQPKPGTRLVVKDAEKQKVKPETKKNSKGY